MARKRRPENGQEFIDYHLKFPRVSATWEESVAKLARIFPEAGASFPITGIFIRVIKDEELVELWGRADSGRYVLVSSYEVCVMSGMLGPKRREGDLQIPEGFYYIERFNPQSRYHLSLGINYPNHSDRILGDADEPGKDIFIHGGCVTVGCLPITDELIREVYVAAVLAKAYGQSKIPFHIFPTRLDDNSIAALKERFDDKDLAEFWENLRVGYDLFEQRRIPFHPDVDVTTGLYRFDDI